ncbi:MAG TPA: DUF2090 domain-containing protein [Actinomycetota bacterium]|nr:DUF2090 domain-containing protein [Actinomycetota bacterium]
MPGSLCMLAFDHRTSLLRAFFGVEGDPGPEDVRRAREAKGVIWDGLVRGRGAGFAGEPAALVDATYGAEVIAAAHAAGIPVAVPFEESGRAELAFEHEDWRNRLERLHPTWAKVLVRYNPAGDAAMNARQRATLRTFTEHCAATGHPTLLELLVPPEPTQAGPAYDLAVRPALMVDAIEELRGDGIAPDLWKVEGLEQRQDCEAVARVAGAPCLVLGRGADLGAVERWLRVASGVEGFEGFAIGRSIWWEPLRRWAEGGDRGDAVAAIAETYRRCAGVFDAGAAG